jgi:hypothetical protein
VLDFIVSRLLCLDSAAEFCFVRWTQILRHAVCPMLIMFMLYDDDAGFRPTGGWESIRRFNTSCHIEVENTSFFKGCF